MRRATFTLTALTVSLLAGASILPGAAFAQDVIPLPSGSASSIVTLPAPVVENYWFSAQIRSDGTIALDGYAPDAATKGRLSALPHVDGKSLEIGGGAPKQYDSVVTYGLRLLSHLQDGRFALRANVMTVKGTASSADDYEATMALVDLARHLDVVVAMAEIEPPAKLAAESKPAPASSVAAPASAPSAEPEAPAAPEAPAIDTPEPAPAAEALAEPTPAAEVPAEPAPAPETPAPAVEPAPAAEAPAQPEQAAPAAPAADYAFSATRSAKGLIALTGDVPADAAKAYFGVVAGDVPTTGLEVVEGAPEGFTAAATAGLRALVLLDDGELKFTDGTWSLHGKAPSTEALASAKGLIAALPDAASWQLDLAGPPPIEACRAGLAAFSADHQILFQSGSAKLTDESVAALGSVATILAECPDAIVHVEGHTDADGDASANLALSVSRAETVTGVLASKGIAADRLYAIGYGETLPVASNDTQAGKQKNRRIVFSVLEK